MCCCCIASCMFVAKISTNDDSKKRLGVETIFLLFVRLCANVLMWVVSMSKFVRVHIFVNVFQNHYSFSAAYYLPLLVLERLDLLRDICAKYADKILASQYFFACNNFLYRSIILCTKYSRTYCWEIEVKNN